MALDELLFINFARVVVLADQFIERRLSEFWFIRFVVAVFTVTDHIDEDIFLELRPEFAGKLHRIHHRLGVVAVNVDGRHLKSTSYTRAVD